MIQESGLTPKQKHAMELWLVEGMTHGQIGEETGKCASTAAGLIERGKKKLRQETKEKESEAGKKRSEEREAQRRAKGGTLFGTRLNATERNVMELFLGKKAFGQIAREMRIPESRVVQIVRKMRQKASPGLKKAIDKRLGR